MVNKCKRQNGITIVALVITIIVLIILSSVVIKLVIGENRNNNKDLYSERKKQSRNVAIKSRTMENG